MKGLSRGQPATRWHWRHIGLLKSGPLMKPTASHPGAEGGLLCLSKHCGGIGEAWQCGIQTISEYSLGSLAELSYILLLPRHLGYLQSQEWGELEALRDHAGCLTWGLYRALGEKSKAQRSRS